MTANPVQIRDVARTAEQTPSKTQGRLKRLSRPLRWIFRDGVDRSRSLGNDEGLNHRRGDHRQSFTLRSQWRTGSQRLSLFALEVEFPVSRDEKMRAVQSLEGQLRRLLGQDL